MSKRDTKNLKAGMVVEKDIVSKQGQTIAKAGAVLNAALIAKLNFYRIDAVYIEDDEPAPAAEKKPEPKPEPPKPKAEPKPEPPRPEPPKPQKAERAKHDETMAYSEKLKRTPKFQEFQINYSKLIATLKTTYKKVIDGDGKAIDQTALLKETEVLFRSNTNLDLFDMLHNMRTIDDSIYAHGVNVALVARALGKWLKFSRDRLNTLTLAGLLFDIGKTQIPDEVLNKSGKLTDEEFKLIRQHPQTGHRMLKRVPNLDSSILYATLQHHERFDGSGYPRNLPGDEIDDCAAVIAIADVYDSMTATRSYRAPKSAFQVIGAFEDDGLNKYNPQFILTFLKNIAAAYQNNRVVLSDGRSAKVVFLNSSKLSKPIVQLDDGTMIDLSREYSLEIQKCL